MTGEHLAGLQLSQLRSLEDLRRIELPPNFLRGHWIHGFGWNENFFQKDFILNRQILDEIFPRNPVFLVRADGHSSCVNTQALSLLGFLDDKVAPFVERDGQGEPTGILRETAHLKVFSILPPKTSEQIRSELLLAMEYFLSRGFTHIRDMTTQSEQWQVELDLFHSGKLHLYAEHNFVCDRPEDIGPVLEKLIKFKKQETPSLKIRGAKIFYDGSLGSHTAALSQNYGDSSGQGNLLWNEADLAKALKIFWKAQLDMSLHVIGDVAAHSAVSVARKVSAEGYVGRLNLEHVQVLRPETIQMMKPLHLRCHMQPCHWLSDQVWLKPRLGLSLAGFS